MKISANLFAFKEREFSEFPGICRALQTSGFHGIEIRNHAGHDTPQHLREVAGDHDLTIVSAYLEYACFKPDKMDETLAFQRAAGPAYLALSAYPFGESPDPDVFIADFRRMTRAATDAGFIFLFHNHERELVTRDAAGRWLLHHLLEEVPGLRLELDVYYLAKTGIAPRQFLEENGDRIGLLHLKDLAGDAEQSTADIGEGVIDFAPILEFAEAQGHRWIVLENHRPQGPPEDSLDTCIKNLRRFAAPRS